MQGRAVSESFRRFAHRVAAAVGTAWAFTLAFAIVVGWGVLGPLFRYSEAWQLSINTGTTIVTFLMVFVIQNTQNRDSQVAQLKLDELIRAVQTARNELVDLEALSDEELGRLHGQFAALRQAALQQAGDSPTARPVARSEGGDTRTGGHMRHSGALLLALAFALAPVARAQPTETTMAFEMRPFVGLFVPTGGMRDDFRSAPLVGFQGGFEINTHSHVLLGGSWSQTKAKFPSLTSRLTDVWQFDAGGEVNLVEPMRGDWYFRPFVGVGTGIRTYDYQAMNASMQTCGVAYGSMGAEAQHHMVAFRFELRDNVSCFTSPVTGSHKTRNDVGLSIGLAYHLM